MLPTREAGPPAAWLTTYPGVEILCRARAGAYAESARLDAPDALQVADRFHLWQGLGRAVETCVAAHRECLRAPTRLPKAPNVDTKREDPGLPGSDPAGRRTPREKAAHALVHELLAQGHSRRAIARHLGWGLNTALRYAQAAHWTPSVKTGPGPAGWTRAYVAAPLRRTRRPRHRRCEVTGRRTRHPTALSAEDRAALKDVLARCPEPDLDAVTAGLSLEWSSGGTEGSVNRIKKIKRQLYGRAAVELLRNMNLLQ